MTLTKRSNVPSANLHDTKLSGVIKTPEGQDAMAHGNLMRLNKIKYKVLHGLGKPLISVQGWVMNRLKAALLRRTWGCCWVRGWT